MYADIAICDQKPVHANGIFRKGGVGGDESVEKNRVFVLSMGNAGLHLWSNEGNIWQHQGPSLEI